MKHRWECFDQLAADVAGELVGAAEEHCRFGIASVLIVRVLGSEVICGQAKGGGAVRDAVVDTAADKCNVTRGEFDCRSWVVEPQPGMTLDDGVNGQLDGAGQAQAPRRSCDRSSEHATRRASSGEVFLEHIHLVRVSRRYSSVLRIETLVYAGNHGSMSKP